ncbi:MAG TPA: choice-of-anchor E domain-containing protein [Gemmataceae bacterium]|nr:choice-of-anchor E domain-containing protein [Gemmataceae bacterium]
MNLFWFLKSKKANSQVARITPRSPASPGRKITRLQVESLEGRDLPSANVISGFVYHDATNNGIYEPGAGETPYANNHIQLRNSNGVVVGDTLTDANGFYQFKSDSTIGTTPKTITQTVTFPGTLTDFVLTGAVDQFNPTLGTLQSIDITNDASISTLVKFENTSPNSPSALSASVSGTVTVLGTASMDLVATPAQLATSFNAAPFDGAFDFAGTSGQTTSPLTSTASQSVHFTGADLTPFIGYSQVGVAAVAQATSLVSGGGNVASVIATSARAVVTVTYTYIPNPDLQPGDYTIVQVDEPPGTINGKVTRDGTILPPAPQPPDTIPVHLTSVDLPNNNFGQLLPATLSGYVYADVSPGGANNGVRDIGEAGIANTQVQLAWSDGVTNHHLTTTTDANGFYQFTNLTPNEQYILIEYQPAGYLNGKMSVGSLGGLTQDGYDVMYSIPVKSGQQGVNYNFGELLPASLSGYVYADVSPGGANNGVRDIGETGIPNTQINLYWSDGVTNHQLTTTTDANGFYQFTNLTPNDQYILVEYQPAGYLNGKMSVGSLGGLTQDGFDVMYSIPVQPGAQGVNYNFGELLPVVSSPPSPPPGPPPSADLAIVKTASAPQVPVGAPVSYTLTVSNLGPDTANQVTVQDTLPTGSTFVSAAAAPGWQEQQAQGIVTFTTDSLAAGATATMTISINATANPGTMLNTATVSSNTPDNNPNNNSSSATVTVIAAIGGTDSTPVPPGPSPFAPAPASFPGPNDVNVLGKNSLFTTGGTSSTDPVLLGQISYVDALYRTLTGAPADNASLITWVSQLRGGMPRAQVAQAVWNTAAHRNQEIQAMYLSYLHRAAGSVDFTYWNGVFAGGASETDVAVAILTSPEYAASHASNAQFVDGLFRDVLSRTPTAAELSAWTANVASSGRAAVARQLLGSTEARGILLTAIYSNYLGRSVSSGDSQYWLGQMQAGMAPEQVAVNVLVSDEFYSRAASAAGV